MPAGAPRIHDFVPNPYSEKELIRDTNFTVLLVEDDEADAYLINDALRRNPKVSLVVRARDGVEALDLIDEYDAQPDIAIVDLKMPRKDGLTLLSEFFLRAHAQFPAIVLTSSTSSSDRLQSWNRGAVEFMTKRDSIDEMAVALELAFHKLMRDPSPVHVAPAPRRRGLLGWLRDRRWRGRLPSGNSPFAPLPDAVDGG